jgi:hypothetical protein
VPVPVCVPVDAARADAPQRDRAEHDQEQSAEHLAAALDHDRERPSEQDDRARAERQQHRMPHREAYRDAQRARACDGGRFAAGAKRQRRDRHQVIGAKAVEKSECECGGKENQGASL